MSLADLLRSHGDDSPFAALHTRVFAQDARRSKSFEAAQKTERFYASQLRRLAKTVGDLVGFDVPGSTDAADEIERRLRKYSELIEPWAKSVAERMLADVNRRNRQVWNARAAEMGRELQHEIANAPTGETMRQLLREQVTLIKSIPIEAAERVHELTLHGITNATRYPAIQREIMRTTEVTEARARLIARTEVSRTSSVLVQSRSQFVGSTEYIWRTLGDVDVRPSHDDLEGTVQKWASPPLCDPPNHHAHPGQIFNCRCWPEPIIPEF